MTIPENEPWRWNCDPWHWNSDTWQTKYDASWSDTSGQYVERSSHSWERPRYDHDIKEGEVSFDADAPEWFCAMSQEDRGTLINFFSEQTQHFGTTVYCDGIKQLQAKMKTVIV